MARLVIERLYKEYKSENGVHLNAVKDLSLTVAAQELLVIVGPSGCGKTTTLRLIAGLEQPTGGLISLDGQSMKGVAPKERDVAMVFQNHALYPHMTAWENMAFGLQLRKFPKAEVIRRVEEASELLGLSGFLARRPEQLSGGERQRVALGRAIVRKPGILLFDEPLSNLDGPLRAEMRAEIARLHRKCQWTTIYVTHDQAEAIVLAERLAVMHQGKIHQIGKPIEVYATPDNLFTAGFMGSPPINLLKGKFVEESGRIYFKPQEAGVACPAFSAEFLRSHIGKEMVLGVRPENVLLGGPVRPGGRAVDFMASIEFVENLGPDAHVHLRCEGNRLVSRVAGSFRYAAGQLVSIQLLLEPLLVFDPATERRVI